MLKLKSKTKVIVDLVSLRQDYVILTIDREIRTSEGITIVGKYTDTENDSFIKDINYPVSNTTANQLGDITIPNNSTLTETRNLQLISGVFAVISQNNDFGLGANDWEVVN
jgi:hypothetical protein